MEYFKILKKSKTYVPTYKYDFIRFCFNSIIFGFCLETILILRGRYEKMYKSSFLKELQKVRDHDNRLTDQKRKKALIEQKQNEIQILEKKLIEKSG